MDNFNIKDSIEELQNKFNEIKKMGYVKGISQNNKGNAGLTFEKLIGKYNDNFQTADYKGIEIKVKNNFSFKNKYKYISLFSLVPSNCFGFELKRIRDSYGTPDKDFPDVKILMKSFYTNMKVKVESGYSFKINVRYSEKRIYLYVYNKHNILVDKSVFWDFIDINDTLNRKLSYLSFVKYNSKLIKGEKHFHYNEIKFYKLKGIDKFFEALENGNIRIYFCLGVYKSGFKKGLEHDHGVTFGIKESDLCKLYEEVLE